MFGATQRAVVRRTPPTTMKDLSLVVLQGGVEIVLYPKSERCVAPVASTILYNVCVNRDRVLDRLCDIERTKQ